MDESFWIFLMSNSRYGTTYQRELISMLQANTWWHTPFVPSRKTTEPCFPLPRQIAYPTPSKLTTRPRHLIHGITTSISFHNRLASSIQALDIYCKTYTQKKYYIFLYVYMWKVVFKKKPWRKSVMCYWNGKIYLLMIKRKQSLKGKDYNWLIVSWWPRH